jgi:predicted amidohydrolase
MKDNVKMTLVQLTDTGDAEYVVQRMPDFFRQAAENGSDIIVFPEYVLGNRIPIEHDRVKSFCSLARFHSMYAVSGLVESHGTRWATTAIVVDRQGIILGRYLKSHPAAGDAPYYWPPASTSPSVSEAQGILGGQFKVFHLDFGPVGILQCYDGYFPEAWGCTSYAGAEIILWINGRDGQIEDAYCITAADCYGCVVAANITNGCNTGFTGPHGSCITASGDPESGRLFPRIAATGDGCVHAAINLHELRKQRKHLRQMHQRRPEMYGLLTQDVKMWQDYPDIPWCHPECENLTNKAQL